MSERNYYMVRAMLSSEEDFKIFFDNNIVAVGWGRINFTEYSDVSELREVVRADYYENTTSQQIVSKKLNEVERFCGR